MNLTIREATEEDLWGLLLLYTQLHGNPMPESTNKIAEIWDNILKDRQHHVIIGLIDDKIVASCVLIVVPNLTHGQQPYALIENVITDEKYRSKGFASALLGHAKELAKKENCYKIMLMTGSREERTLNFYRKAGYNSEDKTAFIQWL